MKTKVLIVDDERPMRASLGELLQSEGYQTMLADGAVSALEQTKSGHPDIAIVDVRMPGRGGLDLIQELRDISPNLRIFMMTGYPSVETAVLAMKYGAMDFFTKPLDFRKLRDQLNQCKLAIASQLRETPSHPVGTLYGESAVIRELRDSVERVAPTEASVIITGESGTGKELVAEAIHGQSPRSTHPFMKINCAAIPDALLESELFGYEKGAFTGALSRKAGLFESANQGSVFLDEIGDMDIRLQSKLLHILQGGEFRRLGGTKDLNADTRIISATNQNLRALIEKGMFREDLYYRLSVICIQTPPLREHIEDIPVLAKRFIADFSRSYGKEEPLIDDEFMAILEAQPWPGNVRELKNCIERAIIFCDGRHLGPQHLPQQYKMGIDRNDVASCPEGTEDIDTARNSMSEARQDLERGMILEALDKAKGNRTEAARLLGIPRRTLYNKLEKLDMSDDART
ncbi:MAG TPA: sigma-54 dependent transcriptional regulator [Rectinemataceae bacterium]|nr:sigma-54 dependent transcriptional regulator [Rectinemataceae bacterium]